MEQEEYNINVNNRHVPLIAFFGTKGGVGKTTIVNKVSSLIARAQSRPNILMVDFDIHHRGLTVLRTGDNFKCPTIHEYLYDENLGFNRAHEVTPSDQANEQGHEYIVPSSNLTAQNVFESLTHTKPELLVERLSTLLKEAAAKYDIKLIIIDCGPIVDPLTASAAFMSDDAFIIGQNEPITFRSLQSYTTRIREFLPDFGASNVRVILNKVRGRVTQQTAIFAVIPFTLEIVDVSEGLTNIDEVRLTFLDDCIRDLIKNIFKINHDEFIPDYESVCTVTQRQAINMIDSYRQSTWYKRTKSLSYLLYAGLVMIAGAVAVYAVTQSSGSLNDASSQSTSQLPSWLGYLLGIAGIGGLAIAIVGGRFWGRVRFANSMIRVKDKLGWEGLLALCRTKSGRKKFDEMILLSQKIEKEI
jgi:cellulose biosynthesis protein BcsQ